LQYLRPTQLSLTKNVLVIRRTGEGKKQVDFSGRLALEGVLGYFEATVEHGAHADPDGDSPLLRLLYSLLKLCQRHKKLKVLVASLLECSSKDLELFT